MLKYAGFTSFTDGFFFRDVDGDGQHRGLQPSGFGSAFFHALRELRHTAPVSNGLSASRPKTSPEPAAGLERVRREVLA